MIRFLIVVACLAIAFPVAFLFAYQHHWIGNLPSFLYETTLFITFTTILIYTYLSRSRNRSFFVQLYLSSMVVKLIAFFAFNLFMILDDRPGALMNVMYFLLTYLVFTAVEIGFLYRKISGNS